VSAREEDSGGNEQKRTSAQSVTGCVLSMAEPLRLPDDHPDNAQCGGAQWNMDMAGFGMRPGIVRRPTSLDYQEMFTAQVHPNVHGATA